MTWVTFHHLVRGLEAGVGDFRNCQLLVVGLLGGDYWCIGSQREVDTWVGHQVGLELRQIDVQGAVKPERGRDGADNLRKKAVQVGVGRTLDVQITAADVVDGLVVDHEGTVGVLQGRMGGQDGVIWLDHSGGDLGSWVDGKLQLGLLTVIHAQPLHQQRSEAGAGASAEAVEDEESLETGTLISQLPHPVKDKVNDLFTYRVVTSGVVVGCVLLAAYQLIWVK